MKINENQCKSMKINEQSTNINEKHLKIYRNRTSLWKSLKINDISLKINEQLMNIDEHQWKSMTMNEKSITMNEILWKWFQGPAAAAVASKQHDWSKYREGVPRGEATWCLKSLTLLVRPPLVFTPTFSYKNLLATATAADPWIEAVGCRCLGRAVGWWLVEVCGDCLS